MALNKRQYTDGQTIITAANLNEIQDCIIALEGNYVPKTRTVAGKALSSNITLAASDVGAVPTSRTINSKALTSNITLSAADVGAVPVSRTVNSKALSSNITLNAADVGAVPSTRTVNGKALSDDISITASDIGAVPTSRKVAGKALTSDITLAASDVGAVPTTRKVNNKALSSNITLSASDVGAVPTTRTVNSKALSSNITLAAADIGYNSTNVGAELGSLNGAINDEATERQNADTAIQNKLNTIGTILDGATSPVVVASGTVVEISSITLPIGSWIILGSFTFSASFSQAANGYLMAGSDVIVTTRGTGINGGTFAPLVSTVVSANNTTVTMKTYQESGSENTASPYYFRAIRIS